MLDVSRLSLGMGAQQTRRVVTAEEAANPQEAAEESDWTSYMNERMALFGKNVETIGLMLSGECEMQFKLKTLEEDEEDDEGDSDRQESGRRTPRIAMV